jgi:hypothetical protein
MSDQKVQLCGLSVNATPHPEDIYISLLRTASNALVRARGSDYAKITSPRKYSNIDKVYTGRILVWTNLDAKGRWIDLNKEDALDEDILRKINIPDNARPNYRSFIYVFDEARHRFWFESKTSDGDTIGPTTVVRIMALLMSAEVQGEDSPEVSVAIIPEDGTLERIFSMPGLKSIVMKVGRPNADSSSPEARSRIFATLSSLYASNMEVKINKDPKADKLTLTDEYRQLAEVAADTGFVRGTSPDADGNLKVVATNDAPKRIYIDPPEGGSVFGRILHALRLD